MLIEAHRGAFKDSPALDENSLSAFKRAIEFHCDFIEFDVHRTLDNQFIIFHNDEISFDKQSYIIKNSSWKNELEQYRLPITNEPLPSLQDVLNTCKGKIKLNIEIKDPTIGKDVVDIVLASGLSTEDFMISSFHESVIADVAAMHKNIYTGFLFLGNLWSLKSAKIALNNSCNAINPYYRFLHRRLVNFARKHTLDIHTWTVNGQQLQKFMQKKYVTSIITNDVLLALDMRVKYH